jgi:hypothetical protein
VHALARQPVEVRGLQKGVAKEPERIVPVVVREDQDQPTRRR